jgi:hypothetical protein
MKELEQLLPEVQANLGPLEQMRVEALAKSHRGNLSMLGALGGGALSSYLLSWLAIWAAVIGGVATVIALVVIYQKYIAVPLPITVSISKKNSFQVCSVHSPMKFGTHRAVIG